MSIVNVGMLDGYEARIAGSGEGLLLILPFDNSIGTTINLTLPDGVSLLPIENTNDDRVINVSTDNNDVTIDIIDTTPGTFEQSISVVLSSLPDTLPGNVTFGSPNAPTALRLDEKFSTNDYDEVWADEGIDPDGVGSVTFEDFDLDVLWGNVPYAFKQKFPANTIFGSTDAQGNNNYLKNISIYIGAVGELNQDMATAFAVDDPRYGEHVPEVVYFGVQIVGNTAGQSVYLAMAHTTLPEGFTSGDTIVGPTTNTKMIILETEPELISLSEYNDFLGGGASNTYIVGPSGLDINGDFDPIVFANTPSAITAPDFVAVAWGSSFYPTNIIISSDGSTWTESTPALPEIGLEAVCWSPDLSLFVAVASDSHPNQVMTSQDGVDWTSRTTPFLGSWNDVCWSSELSLFVAVSGNSLVMTSPDGITWTLRTAPSGHTWQSVCWSPELSIFVAVGNSGTTQVMTSPDGFTWTGRTVSNFAWGSVCWSAGLSLFVAISGNPYSDQIMTSSDGITWTDQTAPGFNDWKSICWSPELSLFAVVSDDKDPNQIMTSPDGFNWTLRIAPSDQNWASVCWSPSSSLFAAIADTYSLETDLIMTSPDGITWTIAPIANNDSRWAAICGR